MAASRVLSGTIEHVAFRQPATGFTVLRVREAGRAEASTVIGTAPESRPGLVVRAEGQWQDDPAWGRQFQAKRITLLPPASDEGLKAYLASGAIKGVGEALATRLVEHFGKDLRQVIEAAPERLAEVPGIGARTARRIAEVWQAEGTSRDILLFLESQGIRPARARRILEAYGSSAVPRLLADPYLLARDIRGIGFATADLLAEQLGIDKDSPIRHRAGIFEVLRQATELGHSALPVERALGEAATLLGQPRESVTDALAEALAERRLVRRKQADESYLLLPELDRAEARIAARLSRLARRPLPFEPDMLGDWPARVGSRLRLELSASQHRAMTVLLESKVAILTGGPGTGKTSLVRAYLASLEPLALTIALAAPTGRAARRLFESTGADATTIHRLLEADAARGFGRRADRPLEIDLLVLDEASMIDLLLMEAVVEALPDHAMLLLVGDKDQLPPVGPGRVLGDLIESGRLPVMQLTEIFRQAAASGIVQGAHQVISGHLPSFRQGDAEDCFGIRVKGAGNAEAKLIELVTTRIPERFGLDPVADIQILTPVNRGPVGTLALNRALQAVLNPTPALFLERAGIRFGTGDKVMQTENDHAREVYNGDLGIIQSIDTAARLMEVRFEDRGVVYSFEQLEQLALAYAVTVHKSQGSEYPAVLLLLLREHGRMLRRQLLYTAMTRARRLLVVLAESSALERAVATPEPARISLLAHRLASEWTPIAPGPITPGPITPGKTA